MSTKLKHRTLWTTAAVITAALMYAFGFALTPVPWLLWVAPVPILLLAPRISGKATFAAAAGVWLLGGVRMWWYFWDSIQMPIPLVVGMAVVLAMGFGAGVVLYRALMVRRRYLAAFIAMPATWVCVEYLMSLVSYDAAGDWYSIAYTQADLPIVLQTVSVTGIWGLSFLLMAVPTAIALIASAGVSVRGRAWVGASMAALVCVTLSYGLIRIGDETQPLRAATLALPASTDMIQIEKPEAKQLSADYHVRIKALGEDGVDVVVLPEKVFSVSQEQAERFLTDWSTLAQNSGIDIVLGLALGEKGHRTNAAVWLPSDGTDTEIYRKQHLIPGLEEFLTTGDDKTVIVGADHQWGMAICKDLDYSDTTSPYGDAGTTVLFVPALDFAVDGWWHSRIAVTRGVEQGISIVRTGQWGQMTISDQYGQMLSTDSESAEAAVSTNGASTIYKSLGDWFAWLSLILLATCVAVVTLGRRSPGNPVKAATVSVDQADQHSH